MQVFGNVVHNRTMPRQSLLNRSANQIDEVVLNCGALLQFPVKLRREHLQQLCVSGYEWNGCIVRPEDDCIPRCTTDHGATEVLFEGLRVATRLHQLHAKRLEPCSCTFARNGEHPRKAVLYEDCGFDIDSQRPTKLDRPLVLNRLLQNLFWS